MRTDLAAEEAEGVEEVERRKFHFPLRPLQFIFFRECDVIHAEPVVNEIRINAERLWGSLMDMARIGAAPRGGVRRLTLTELDRQGRGLFVSWCKEAGLAVTVDGVGNLFVRRAGRNNAMPSSTRRTCCHRA